MLGTGFGHPDVIALQRKELQATVTAVAVRQLPDVWPNPETLPLRNTCGLVAWYRALAKLSNG